MMTHPPGLRARFCLLPLRLVHRQGGLPTYAPAVTSPAPYNDNQQAFVMGYILLKIFIILAVVGVLALITLDDRRTRRLRAEEDRARLEAEAGERTAQRGDDTAD